MYLRITHKRLDEFKKKRSVSIYHTSGSEEDFLNQKVNGINQQRENDDLITKI